MLHSSRIFAFLLVTYLVVVYFWSGTIPSQRQETVINQASLREGQIIEELQPVGNSQSIIIETPERTRLSGIIPKYPEFNIGDRVVVVGKLIPRAEADYFKTNPGYFLTHNISHTVEKAEVALVREVAWGPRLSDYWYSLRRALIGVRKRYEATLLASLPEPYGGLSIGILLGNRAYLDTNISNLFITVGIIHIMALSGYNITIIAGNLERAFGKHSVRLAQWGAFLGIWAFVMATGFSASVVRAAIMGSALIFAKMLGRQSDSLVAILLAAALMTAANPYILRYDIGFQLSFAAMFGMIYLAPRLWGLFKALGPRATEILSATIAAQIFTFPLLSVYFGRISLISVIANALTLPFIPLIMLLIFIVGTIGLVSMWLAQKISLVLWFSLGYLVRISEVLGSLPRVAGQYQMSGLTLIGIYLILLELVVILKKRESVHEKV